MAWFDILGGLAGGLQSGSQAGLAAIQQKKAEARQAILDKQSEQEFNQKVQEFEQGQAEKFMAQLQEHPGTDVDLNDPAVKNALKYFKSSFGKGSTPGTVSLIETPEQVYRRKDLAYKEQQLARDIETFGETGALKKQANTFLTGLQGKSGKELENYFASTPRAHRERFAAMLGVKPETLLTPAERTQDINLTPTVFAARVANAPQPFRPAAVSGGYIIQDKNSPSGVKFIQTGGAGIEQKDLMSLAVQLTRAKLESIKDIPAMRKSIEQQIKNDPGWYDKYSKKLLADTLAELQQQFAQTSPDPTERYTSTPGSAN